MKEELVDANHDDLRAELEAIETDAKQMAEAARRVAVEVQDLVCTRIHCFMYVCINFHARMRNDGVVSTWLNLQEE
jgi:hypothetical protein